MPRFCRRNSPPMLLFEDTIVRTSAPIVTFFPSFIKGSLLPFSSKECADSAVLVGLRTKMLPLSNLSFEAPKGSR
jgi:hypothetical protein